jgi:hypothetical protein
MEGTKIMDQAQSDEIAALKYTVSDEIEGAYGHWLDAWLSEGATAGCSCVRCGAHVTIDCDAIAVLHEESPAADVPCDAHKQYARAQAGS